MYPNPPSDQEKTRKAPRDGYITAYQIALKHGEAKKEDGTLMTEAEWIALYGEAIEAANTAAEEAHEAAQELPRYVQAAQAAQAGAETARDEAESIAEQTADAVRGELSEYASSAEAAKNEAEAARDAAEQARDEAEAIVGSDYATEQYVDEKIAEIPAPDMSSKQDVIYDCEVEETILASYEYTKINNSVKTYNLTQEQGVALAAAFLADEPYFLLTLTETDTESVVVSEKKYVAQFEGYGSNSAEYWGFEGWWINPSTSSGGIIIYADGRLSSMYDGYIKFAGDVVAYGNNCKIEIQKIRIIPQDEASYAAFIASAVPAGSITNGKIADSTIVGGKLKTPAINTGHLYDGAVTTAKIANKAVTADKLADGVIPDPSAEDIAVPSSTATALGLSEGASVDDALNAISTDITVSVGATWEANTAGGFMQTVSVSGVLATDNPIADVILGSDVDANAIYLEAWGCVTRITTADGSITLYANGDAPTTAFTIQLKVVR